MGGEIFVEQIPREPTNHRFVGIPSDVTNLRKIREFLGRALRITSSHNNTRVRIP